MSASNAVPRPWDRGEKVTNVIAAVCLVGAVLFLFAAWRAVAGTPQRLSAADSVTDVTTYDIDDNGQPEFVEIGDEVHQVPVAAAGPDWVGALAGLVGAVVCTFLAPVGGGCSRRPDPGPSLHTLDRRLSALETPVPEPRGSRGSVEREVNVS